MTRSRREDTNDLELARARAFLRNARDAIVSIDVAGRVTDFNQAAEEMFGYRAEDVLGHDVSLLMPPPYREEHTGYIERYRRTGEARAIGRIREVEARRRDGKVFPIELSVAEIPGADAPGYTAIIRDVSTLRATLEALRRERDFSDQLVDTVPLLVLVLDRDGRIVRLNRYAEEATGHSLTDVEGEPLETFVVEKDRKKARASFDRALAGQPDRGIDVAVRAHSGEERLLNWHAAMLHHGDGGMVGVLVAGDDVTQRRSAENELRRLEARSREQERLADIGAIAAKLVHDIGNPLSGISMQAQLLLRRARTEEPDRESLVRPAERIAEAVGGLTNMIRSFMDFAREQRLDLSPIDVGELVRDAVALWTPVAAEAGVSLTHVDAADLPTLVGDRAKLRRVLDNLLKNAIEAARAGGGNVHVHAAAKPDRRIRICIEDDGPGVPSGRDCFRLFETTRTDGTGIGLAVAKQIVTAHGGEVTLVNRDTRGAAASVDLTCGGPHG